MYPVSVNRASTSFCRLTLVASLYLVAGCGVSGSPAPALLALPEEAMSSLPGCARLSSERGAPPVYRCETSNGPLFVAAMYQCGVPDKMSYQATTRQLLVGITNLELVHQTPVIMADTKVLRSTFRGVIDADTILGSTFTRRNGDCMSDVIVWKVPASPLKTPEEVDPFTQSATQLALSIRPEALRSGRR